jgi:glycosidase
LLYQINTRVRLAELSQALGRAASLDDIPDFELDCLAERGFNWIWLLSIWQTGPAGQQVSRSNQQWRKEFEATLPDLKEEDIAGSGFAICDYTVHERLGGEAALARLRQRLYQRGLRLLLDFVPNHTALDHHWVATHPEYYISGTEHCLSSHPENYRKIKRNGDELILAHGRDPYFPGWPDTLQLDYSNPDTKEAMTEELLKIARQCDGVRCDMAMLILPDIFEHTWGRKSLPFWCEATSLVRKSSPDFCFMAEVYWEREWALQQQGFDYTYDKRLYDRLRAGNAGPVREHLQAPIAYQSKLARFLENHDEQRAAAAFPLAIQQAAAVVTYLSPGLRFFHQGQLEGRKKRISPHLARGPQEMPEPALQEFYENLLAILRRKITHQGDWQLLECRRAWDDNWTADCFICFAWQETKNELLLVAVNYSSNQSQCYVRLPFADLETGQWHLQDQINHGQYERNGSDLLLRGLFLDLPAWQCHAFLISRLPDSPA